ncbi:hypothetical protein ACFL5G_01255 [Candidatus Margulisiibacteriota bacterium]
MIYAKKIILVENNEKKDSCLISTGRSHENYEADEIFNSAQAGKKKKPNVIKQKGPKNNTWTKETLTSEEIFNLDNGAPKIKKEKIKKSIKVKSEHKALKKSVAALKDLWVLVLGHKKLSIFIAVLIVLLFAGYVGRKRISQGIKSLSNWSQSVGKNKEDKRKALEQKKLDEEKRAEEIRKMEEKKAAEDKRRADQRLADQKLSDAEELKRKQRETELEQQRKDDEAKKAEIERKKLEELKRQEDLLKNRNYVDKVTDIRSMNSSIKASGDRRLIDPAAVHVDRANELKQKIEASSDPNEKKRYEAELDEILKKMIILRDQI